MESKIMIFESGIKDGIMSANAKFYADGVSKEERERCLLKVRLNLGKKYHFDGKKIFHAKQKLPTEPENYPDGKYIVLNETHMNKDDFWEEQLPADILILSEKYKNIVVGNQMADCPILIIEDRRLGVTALSHCGVSYINRKLPLQTVEALQKEYNSNVSDLYVYIGSCIKKNSYVYDCYPAWATNDEVWQDCINQKDNNYYIDLIKAIENQLKAAGITNINISSKDTATSDEFYSYSAANKGNIAKKGQNFVGFFYK